MCIHFAFVRGKMFNICLSTQFPPEAPVSKRALIAVVPISISAEQRNSGRVYPELFGPTVPPWLAPLAIENPVGNRNKRHSASVRTPSESAHTASVQPKSYHADKYFDWHLRLDAWARNNDVH